MSAFFAGGINHLLGRQPHHILIIQLLEFQHGQGDGNGNLAQIIKFILANAATTRHPQKPQHHSFLHGFGQIAHLTQLFTHDSGYHRIGASGSQGNRLTQQVFNRLGRQPWKGEGAGKGLQLLLIGMTIGQTQATSIGGDGNSNGVVIGGVGIHLSIPTIAALHHFAQQAAHHEPAETALFAAGDDTAKNFADHAKQPRRTLCNCINHWFCPLLTIGQLPRFLHGIDNGRRINQLFVIA